ncbi:ATP-dependent DNA ligase [Pseudonocardia sp. Cha107L01]|uniref:ATP-dependent DNA ligase n=1 Tax=Pseudonocardia sp. Cha107L01 TaxID=3457576 RepID=UPI00403E4D24
MIAVTVQELPTSSRVGWAYEPKMDGFRLLAHRGAQRVALHSRQQRPLGRYFPEIVTALRQLDVEVVLDGELVLWRNGRRPGPHAHVHRSRGRSGLVARAL